MNILVVDDQRDIRDMLTALLEDSGYSVATAANGRVALDYLRESAELPRLILLDIAMPVMTGWDFLREQQRDDRLASIPVIIMTARGHFDNEGHDVFAADYIHKPTELQTLLAVIEHHCAVGNDHITSEYSV